MLKKFRIWYWITSAFIKKYLAGIVIGSILGIVLVVYADPLVQMLPIVSTTQIGRIGTFTLAQMPIDIQQQVSRGLTKINQKGEWVPDVAKSITPNDDGTQYTVVLNQDVFWKDGKALTVADIDLTVADVDIQKPDDQTIIFTLKESFAPFPSILSQPILKKNKVGFIRKKTIISGLNDFSITNVETNGQYLKKVTLTANNETRIYHFYASEEEALIAFKLGHIDSIEGLTVPVLQDWPRVKLDKQDTTNRYLALFFNTSDQNLQDKSFRQLLAYATPKSTEENRVISPISRNSWAYNPQVKPYVQNIDTAKASLEKLRSVNPNLDPILVLTTTPSYVDIAEKIIDAWKQVGINVSLQIVAYPDTNDYQILLIGQQIPDDPDQYLLWHSTQITNISKYQNPKIDKLLEDGRQQTKNEERKQTYQDFQRFLVEDSPVVFLEQLSDYTLSRI